MRCLGLVCLAHFCLAVIAILKYLFRSKNSPRSNLKTSIIKSLWKGSSSSGLPIAAVCASTHSLHPPPPPPPPTHTHTTTTTTTTTNLNHATVKVCVSFFLGAHSLFCTHKLKCGDSLAAVAFHNYSKCSCEKLLLPPADDDAISTYIGNDAGHT